MKNRHLLSLLAGIAFGATPCFAALSDGLVAYYDFDTDFSNKVSSSYGGVATGATIQSGAGISGGAADLNAAGDKISVAGLGSSVLGNSFTISGWYKFDAEPPESRRMYMWESISDNWDVSLGTQGNVANPPGSTAFATYYNSSAVTQSASVAITGGTWMYFVQTFSYNGSDQLTMNTYLNGILVPAMSTVRTISTADDLANFSGINFGNARNGQSRGFNGQIDEVAVWSRSLDATEITALYNLGLAGSAVPEPSTYGLIGAGALAGVAAVRRRRKAK